MTSLKNKCIIVDDMLDTSEYDSDKRHPGAILYDDFLVPLDMSPHTLAAKFLHVHPARVYNLVNGRSPCSIALALRLAHVFNMSNKYFWAQQQVRYDMVAAEINFKNGPDNEIVEFDMGELAIKLGNEPEPESEYEYELDSDLEYDNEEEPA